MKLRRYQLPERFLFGTVIFLGGVAPGEHWAIVAAASLAAFLLTFLVIPPEYRGQDNTNQQTEETRK